jgi:hypothetical protein
MPVTTFKRRPILPQKPISKFVGVELMGGLGNQLFQVAATLAYSKDHNINPVFPVHPKQSVSRTVAYKTSFFHELTFNSAHYNDTTTQTEKSFKYVPLLAPTASGKPLKLSGYFQSEKYFEKHKNYILNTIALPLKFQETIKKKYVDITSHPLTVSIHVRRGDYLRLQHVHYIQPIEYYERAIKQFNPKSLFVIFSDDIEWCKTQNVFNDISNKVYISGELDYNDLYLMSLCKHNIIANSTFSWWGAYLNLNRKKKVIAPSTWFGESGPKDTQDLLPESWNVI